MAKYCFTTVASCDCFYKLLILYNSLNYHNIDFELYTLCADEKSYEVLSSLRLGRMQPVRLAEVEDAQLLAVKNSRSFMEYCWTLKASVLHYIMKKYRNTQYYAHLDSDLCFFSNIDGIFEEAPGASIYITDHNNSPEFLYTYETSGRFNSGFIGVRNDSMGFEAIRWWRDRCIEWCHVSPDPVRKLYGDQRYLEQMANMFPNVHVVRNKGANAAHWNIKKYRVSIFGNTVYLDENRLIFYHFSGFSILSPNEFNLSWLTPLDKKIIDAIYLPYMVLLSDIMKNMQDRYQGFNGGFSSLQPGNCRLYYKLKNR